jgi:hypothetical protein
LQARAIFSRANMRQSQPHPGFEPKAIWELLNLCFGAFGLRCQNVFYRFSAQSAMLISKLPLPCRWRQELADIRTAQRPSRWVQTRRKRSQAFRGHHGTEFLNQFTNRIQRSTHQTGRFIRQLIPLFLCPQPHWGGWPRRRFPLRRNCLSEINCWNTLLLRPVSQSRPNLLVASES